MDELLYNIAVVDKEVRQLAEMAREYHAKAEKYNLLERIITAELNNKRSELAEYEAMQDRRNEDKRERGNI